MMCTNSLCPPFPIKKKEYENMLDRNAGLAAVLATAKKKLLVIIVQSKYEFLLEFFWWFWGEADARLSS